ncbi:hypothetical protein [Methylocystis heyeri]|uniref:DUF4405 domain-containing protein n=1 Tax=Methylocystis heyeri TaxID=391905 RepID=A0A6B8KMQ7_9HYPH|nr:hypothetical protein [Methylocystis heyeri]QGM48203.1 hypothetical protein H2LOC_020645 [Methylocystis heyeri]
MIYATVAALFVTGAGWLIADQFKDSEAGEAWQSAMAGFLMVHGGAAMAMLLLLGALGPLHVARSWRARKNRVTGGTMAAINACLVVTAFGLYYSGSPDLRTWTSNLHIAFGVALPSLMFAHIAIGRRSRRYARQLSRSELTLERE